MPEIRNQPTVVRFSLTTDHWVLNPGIEGGFPHSEIPGSKLVRSSPRLIAAYHVLHRLSAPRHPPNALKSLDRSHHQCPSARQRTARAFFENKCSLETRARYEQFDRLVID